MSTSLLLKVNTLVSIHVTVAVLMTSEYDHTVPRSKENCNGLLFK